MTPATDQPEIERKFLLRHLPRDLDKHVPVAIRQGYLMQCESREARVRQKGDQWLLTVKDGSGLTRREVEITLSPEQGAALWPLTEGQRVHKQRYVYPYQDFVLEIDVFEEGLAPLHLCEIEFPSVEAARAFAPPAFLGAEVTEEPGYRNADLARRGLPSPPGHVDQEGGAGGGRT